MKAGEAQFLPFLQKMQQFVIPIYQRTYSWDRKECDQLWSDIFRAATDDAIRGHFIGSVVYVHEGVYHIASIPKLHVIDGQQRLTTVTLLILALANAIEDGKPSVQVTPQMLRDFYLFNQHGSEELRYRLLLTRSDRETLMRLLEGQEQLAGSSRRIRQNYEFFRGKINGSSLTPDEIFRGLSKLLIVDISLDATHDNPQLIFESLNSTGMELSKADLIRNYVLMGQPPQEMEDLYNAYWFPMEQRFSRGEASGIFDRFMRDYLTLKTGHIPNVRDVYAEFKLYAGTERSGSLRDIVADIARFSQYYANMALAQEPDEALRQAFQDIDTLKVDVVYPLLLPLYEAYQQGQFPKEQFLNSLLLIESYVFRRSVCGIATNSMNKTFATLARDLDHSDRLSSLTAALTTLDAYRRFPDDDEFRRSLMVKDVYNFRTRNYLLGKLENSGHKDRVIVERHTIEHILPQNPNLSPAWQADLGPDWKTIQLQYLHTLGNLTLTLYNPNMSDRPFAQKRDMEGGFRKTPLLLNAALRDLEHWGEAEIVARAENLAAAAVQVWPSPKPLVQSQIGPPNSVTETPRVASLEDFSTLTGELLVLFEQLRTRVLNLDSSVSQEVTQAGIMYWAASDFMMVVPQQRALEIRLSVPLDDADDPTHLCEVTADGNTWDDVEIRVSLTRAAQLEDALYLVLQAFDRQREDAAA